MHKLPKVVRLDDSDLQVYEHAAEPGEWAVSGSFEFLDVPIESLTNKKLQAFRSGFLGIKTSGRSTLVVINSLQPDEYQNAINQLTVNILSNYGISERSLALNMATEEIRYAEGLCEYDEGTVLALDREFTSDEIKESFKKFVPAESADWGKSKPLIYRIEGDL